MNVPAVAYLSPVLRFDQEANLVLIQYRNPETGEVSHQIPSDAEVARRRRVQADPIFAAQQIPPEQAVTQATAARAVTAAASSTETVATASATQTSISVSV